MKLYFEDVESPEDDISKAVDAELQTLTNDIQRLVSLYRTLKKKKSENESNKDVLSQILNVLDKIVISIPSVEDKKNK